VHVIIILVRVVKNNFSAALCEFEFCFESLVSRKTRDIFRERDLMNHPPFLDVHEDVSLIILT